MNWINWIINLFTRTETGVGIPQTEVDEWYKQLKDDKRVMAQLMMPLQTEVRLVIKRTTFTNKSTIGELYVDGRFECYTLEDHDRLSKGQEKIKHETAIPKGTYEIQITYSPRFRTKLPLLKDVPGFSGIRIHPGNSAKDTSGCILVGETRGPDFIGRSRRAFNKLYKILEQAESRDRTITISIE